MISGTRSHTPLVIFAMKFSTSLWSSITFCELLWYTLSLQYPHRNPPSKMCSLRVPGIFSEYLEIFPDLTGNIFLLAGKSSEPRSGQCGDHAKALFLEMTFIPNKSSKCLIVAVIVWSVALSYWDHWLSNRRSWRHCSNPWKESITLRYRFRLIVST